MASRHFREGDEPIGEANVQRVIARVDIPASTLVRVGIAVLLMLATLWLVRTLAPVIVMTIIALLVAVVLSSFVRWLESKGVGRGLAAAISVVSVLLVAGIVLAITIPPLVYELDE